MTEDKKSKNQKIKKSSKKAPEKKVPVSNGKGVAATGQSPRRKSGKEDMKKKKDKESRKPKIQKTTGHGQCYKEAKTKIKKDIYELSEAIKLVKETG